MIALFSFPVDFFIYNYGGLVNIKRKRESGPRHPEES
jgi:hypothetical protein